MASDRARISVDPSRGYRAVVQQQGRVTLEADGNEAARLAETALREDVIDIVGVSGTPDDGYLVTASGSGFQVGPGTYYLGGWRVTLGAAMPVGGGGPDALDLPATALGAGNYALALLLTEQEVSATEDRALREVALGGPDTAQRTRLMQRAVAISMTGTDCAGSAAAITAALTAQGATLDAETGAILPAARLQVSLIAPPASTDPCDPPATGGYLGADNQLIRVSVTGYDPQTRQGKLVWGYDNAATLYRASTTNGTTIALEGEPVDADHAPRKDQAVEILQTRAVFDNGEIVAADSGTVTSVTRAYDTDLKSLDIAATLPAGSRGTTARPILLRLWEQEIAFVPGTRVELGKTGLAVTVTLGSAVSGDIVARPYWCFAARPSTPVIVYPRRMLDAAQPPEGPRQWLAPLAVGTVANGTASVTDDCRETFVPLTKIKPGGCCGIILDAPTVEKRPDLLQKALDELAGTRGTLTLKPGRYRLPEPLRLTKRHRGLTIEGCSEGVFLEPASSDDPHFLAGLILLDDADEITLRSLQFQMPVAPAAKELRENGVLLGGRTVQFASIGVAATGSGQLVITHCQFRFRLPEEGPTLAVGLLLRGECWGLTLTGNRFLHDEETSLKESAGLLYGVLLAPAIVRKAGSDLGVTVLKDARLDALLDAAEISGNEFAGLSVAVLILARLCFIRIERNRVHDCVAGILLQDSSALVMLSARDAWLARLLPLAPMLVAMALAGAIPGAGKMKIAEKLTTGKLAAVKEAAKSLIEELTGLLADDGSFADQDTAPLASIVQVATAVQALFGPTEPRLHVAGNDIDIVGTLKEDTPSTNQPRPTTIIGEPALLLALERRERHVGDILVTANRIASRLGPAAIVYLPEQLVFSSNIVTARSIKTAPALRIVAGTKDSRIEVMANVTGRVSILPSARPVPPSSDWDFVNRIG